MTPAERAVVAAAIAMREAFPRNVGPDQWDPLIAAVDVLVKLRPAAPAVFCPCARLGGDHADCDESCRCAPTEDAQPAAGWLIAHSYEEPSSVGATGCGRTAYVTADGLGGRPCGHDESAHMGASAARMRPDLAQQSEDAQPSAADDDEFGRAIAPFLADAISPQVRRAIDRIVSDTERNLRGQLLESRRRIKELEFEILTLRPRRAEDAAPQPVACTDQDEEKK